MQDLLGGQHVIAFDPMPASAPHVRSGSCARSPCPAPAACRRFPDVPTAEEAGLPGVPDHDLVRRVRARRHSAAIFAGGMPKRESHAVAGDALEARSIGADGTVSRSPEEFRRAGARGYGALRQDSEKHRP